jgi:hypothetical protein
MIMDKQPTKNSTNVRISDWVAELARRFEAIRPRRTYKSRAALQREVDRDLFDRSRRWSPE